MRAVALFTYGSLEFAEIMQVVTGLRFGSSGATLRDFRCRLLSGRVYPGILPAPGEAVRGTLYASVDAESLAVLDEFEGEPYQRRCVLVETAAGSLTPAQAYVVEASRASLLSEEAWSPELFRERHYAAFLRLCDGFARELRRRGHGSDLA